MNHAAKGVTDKDFHLAKKIEEVVMWQPGVTIKNLHWREHPMTKDLNI